MNGRTHALEQLLGGYFHQDWRSEFANVREAIAAYRRGTSAATRAAVRLQLRKLLAGRRSAADLARIISHLGCAYWPGNDPAGFRRWLEEVERELGEG